MKTIKFKFIALLVLLAGIGIACSSNNDDPYCFVRQATPATEVTGPTTTTIDLPVVLDVTYLPYGTCGKFNAFSETDIFPKDITIVVDYEGCECPENKDTKVEPYTFKSNKAGTYELRFRTGNTSNPYISKTITVTE
ncbi:hypothetical protein ACX0HA_11730 [Flavobacterium hauense]